jgi:hypothetical protein
MVVTTENWVYENVDDQATRFRMPERPGYHGRVAPVWAFGRHIARPVDWVHMVNINNCWAVDAIWHGTPSSYEVADEWGWIRLRQSL